MAGPLVVSEALLLMDRRTFVGVFAGGSLSLCRIARGQPTGRLPIVGVLVTESVGNVSLPILIQGLRDLGYVPVSEVC